MYSAWAGEKMYSDPSLGQTTQITAGKITIKCNQDLFGSTLH